MHYHYPIMIVDDNRIVSQVISKVLHSLGYEVVIAHSGREALEKIKKKKPKVILLDLSMPVMNGYDLAKNIKKDENLQDIILIAFTGKSKNEDRLKARRSGFDHFINKTASVSELRMILNAYEYL